MSERMNNWSCADCDSTHLRFSLGPCDGCGESLDGEQSPASRSEGMFHRRCWNARESAPDDHTDGARRRKPYLCGCPSDDPRPCPLHDRESAATTQAGER